MVQSVSIRKGKVTPLPKLLITAIGGLVDTSDQR